jgi:hypothetical protein
MENTNPLRILVVDDNVDSADSLASLLELEGNIAIPVCSAQEALDCGAGIRLIALSGYGQTEDREKPEAAAGRA